MRQYRYTVQEFYSTELEDDEIITLWNNSCFTMVPHQIIKIYKK